MELYWSRGINYEQNIVFFCHICGVIFTCQTFTTQGQITEWPLLDFIKVNLAKLSFWIHNIFIAVTDCLKIDFYIITRRVKWFNRHEKFKFYSCGTKNFFLLNMFKRHPLSVQL